MIWPETVAPYRVHLLALGKNEKVKEAADKLYDDLMRHKFEVLYDDREEKSAGEKLADADLIGLPFRVIISEKTLADDSAELKKRNSDQVEIIKIREVIMKTNV